MASFASLYSSESEEEEEEEGAAKAAAGAEAKGAEDSSVRADGAEAKRGEETEQDSGLKPGLRQFTEQKITDTHGNNIISHIVNGSPQTPITKWDPVTWNAGTRLHVRAGEVSKPPDRPVYQKQLVERWSLTPGRRPKNGSSFEENDNKNGFLIVMRRNKMMNGEPHVEFQQNGFGHHTAQARDFRPEHKKQQYNAIRLEKFKHEFFVPLPDGTFGESARIHPLYQICLNQVHDEELPKLDRKTRQKTQKIRQFGDFNNASRMATDNNRIAAETWEGSRKKGVKPLHILPKLFRDKITNLRRKKTEFARPFIEKGATETGIDKIPVYHDFECPGREQELIVTPGISEETQQYALGYAQLVFDTAKNSFQHNHVTGQPNKSLENVEVPLTLVHSHRHIFFKQGKDKTKYLPERPKESKSKESKGEGEEEQTKVQHRWRVQETYIFMASSPDHDAIVAAVTRPRLRRNFSKNGNYVKMPAMEPYMYLPYYAHLLWNNLERLLILSSAEVNDAVKTTLGKDLKAIRVFWKSIGWCLLRYVVYANQTLNKGNYIQWVVNEKIDPGGLKETAREAFKKAYRAFAENFRNILNHSGCFVERFKAKGRSQVPEPSLGKAMVLARAALGGDAVQSSGSGEGASKWELHETAERLGLRF